MKVLWFVNVPIPPIGVALPTPGEYVGSGWWISWLFDALRRRDDLDLHIAWGHEGSYHNVVHIDSHTAAEAFPLWRASKPSTPGTVRPGMGGLVSLLSNRYPAGLDDVVRRVRPDIIHIHGTEGPYAMLLGRTDIPSLVSIQGSPGDWAKRYWGGSSTVTKLRNPRAARSHLLFVLAGRREARMMANARAIHGGTSWDRRFARRLAPGVPFHHGTAAVGPAFFAARRSVAARADREKVVLTAFSPQPYKGVELAVKAVASLRRTGQRVRLVLAGSCPRKAWGREILRAVDTAGCGAIEVTGYLQPKKLAERLAAADVFVLPSYMENAPNVLLEAMCVGVPCVAARVGGVASMLRDRVEGLLFRRGDLDDLKNKVERLLVDAEFSERLGHAAAVRVRSTSAPDTVASRTVDIYRSVMSSEGQCSGV
jgi:glycosyltransferase involved in cell wall biosynthesis